MTTANRPRTHAAQDASWEKFGNSNDYGRMIEAYAFAGKLEDEITRVLTTLGGEGCDARTDPVAVIEMLRSWEVDASVRADKLAKHLTSVIEIARTWQPDYATKMDRDTLDLAAAEVSK